VTGAIDGRDAPLTVRVLGGVAAARDGVEIDLGGRRQRAVFAVLLTARGRPTPAGRLIDLVWGDEPPPSATGALQSYVSHLRRRLEPERRARGRSEILRSTAAGYSVHLPADAVDAWRFEAQVAAAAELADPAEVAGVLGGALKLWGGTAYAGYEGEPWADAEATRWAELKAAAEDRLFAARLEVDQPGLLIPDLEAAVAAAPLREERWRLLAIALYREHRQGDALAALRRARTTLADELGIDPGPALRELEAQLHAQAPELLPVAAPVARVRIVPESVSATPVLDEIVDRDGELAQMDAVLAQAASGSGAVLVVQGPAGIGKTRLLAEARARAAASGHAVLAARGSQLEQQFSFGAVRQLFEPLLRTGADEAELFSGAAEAARVVFDSSPATSADRMDGVFTVVHGLYWLTLNASGRQPLLLGVDDLQWCDTGSLRFFAYLARRLDGLPVTLATTLRTGEEFADAALIDELRHEQGATVIQPWPLSLGGVGDLVRRRLGAGADGRFVAACHRTTGGNPLLLRQVLRALEADRIRPDAAHADVVTAIGSRAIASLVLMRLSRLPREATSVARAVAVLGDGAELPTVAALAGLAEPDAADAIAALARSEVLRDEYPLSFVHPLIRDAIYRDVPTGVRQLQHERAARALDAAGASPEQVAAHLLQVPARGDRWVCDVLRRAASVAADRGTPESAATYLERALAEPPPAGERTEMLLQLGGVQGLRDGRSAIRHLREAYDLLPDGPDKAALAQTLTQVLIFAGERGDATRFAHEIVESLHPALVDERQGMVGLERVSAFMHGLGPAVWERSSATLSGDGPGARRLAAARSWEVAIQLGSMAEAVELAEFALRDGVLQQHDTGLLWVVAAIVLDFADIDMTEFWSDARAKALAEGSLFSILAVHLWWGHVCWRAGDLREAQALLAVSNEQSAEWGSEYGVPYGDAYLTHVMLDRGDLAGARRHVEHTRPRTRMGDGARLWLEAECRLLLAEGRYAEALARTDELASVMPYITNPVHRPWHAMRAEALAGLGRTGEALELATESVELSRTWGAARQTGAALSLLGRIAGAGGERHLREAVEVLAPTTARVELVRAQLRLARLLGTTEQALGLLRQAYDLADHCTADALRAEADTLLTAAGEPAALRTRVPRLTTLERRIARMAVDGADEREIAQALFLTPRAVQLALSEIRSRIGGESDDDLAAALAS
jgi:DNA-binding SARP family transcriptional activator/tetratricopeptide (TPR) repeat protein